MDPPASLYMIDYSNKPGRLIDIQVSGNMRYIAASFIRREPRVIEPLDRNSMPPQTIEEDKKSIFLYCVDHAKEAQEGVERARQMEQE